MEEIVYVSVRLLCAAYILRKVWGFKAEVRQVCDLFCDSARQGEVKKEESVQINNGAVIGETKFIYLDENAGTAVAPYMSQPLERAAIEEAGDIIEADDVECNLPLEEMKLLKEEQERLDADSPEVETISGAVTQADLENMGDVLFRIDGAAADEEKSLRAAKTLYAIRETDMFNVISSQVENKDFITELMDKYLDEDGNPLPTDGKDKAALNTGKDWRTLL